MAKFEIVVRPVVFPNIRPPPARSLPPEDDPTQGFATIRGNGAQILNSSKSVSLTLSRSRANETQRRVDETRVYQKDDDGTVNKDNFVDIDVANKIWTEKPVPGDYGTTDPEFAGTEKGTHDPRGGTTKEITFYQRPEEADNIEIRNKDVIKKKVR
jgi:hypothetical protein